MVFANVGLQAVVFALDLLQYLDSIANYTTTLDLPTNSLRNASGGSISGSTDAIFVNGNLARVLLAAHLLKPSSAGRSDAYLQQGLGWCDTFASLQAQLPSSRGNPAGYWGTGYSGWANCTARPLRGDCAHSGAIYFGDTGTAVTTLALCTKLAATAPPVAVGAPSAEVRTATYLATLEKYATFVLEGSSVAPVNKKGTVDSFVNTKTGAVGCGYYRCSNLTSDNCADVPGDARLNCPSTHPYTIATGTTGGAFFAELYNLTGNTTYAEVAAAAMAYEATVVMPSGEVPYILDGVNCTTSPDSDGCHSVGGPWPYDTASYVTEGIAAVDLLLPDDAAHSRRQKLVAKFKPTVDFLVNTQNSDGFWGVMHSGDTLRSPRVLSLLSWWLSAVDTPTYRDEPVHEAIDKYLNFLLGPDGAPGAAYGVAHDSILTGMVGLAVADAISFGVTF